MVSTSGAQLLPHEAIQQLSQHLLPHTTVLTPNIPEAALILRRMGVREAITLDSGGAAGLWTVTGRDDLPGPQVGRFFGAAMNTPWHRHLPMAIVINARPL